MSPDVRALQMLGLARRAGRIESGEFSTEKAVRYRKAQLVIVANDASENTKKNFSSLCAFYKVPIRIFSTKEELGHAIGQEMRASAAVTDENFARALEKMLTDGDVVRTPDEDYNGGRKHGRYES